MGTARMRLLHLYLVALRRPFSTGARRFCAASCPSPSTASRSATSSVATRSNRACRRLCAMLWILKTEQFGMDNAHTNCVYIKNCTRMEKPRPGFFGRAQVFPRQCRVVPNRFSTFPLTHVFVSCGVFIFQTFCSYSMRCRSSGRPRRRCTPSRSRAI